MITPKQRLLLANIQYKNWELIVDTDYIQWKWLAPCCKTGDVKLWKSRKWYISEHMVESELVGTAFLALKTALEHEAREFFTYKSQPIYNPHTSVGALIVACQSEEIRS